MARKKIPAEVKKSLDQYLAVLKQDNLPIKEAILFGSFAKGSKKWAILIFALFRQNSRAEWRDFHLWRKNMK